MTKLTESQIRAIAQAAKEELGEAATYERLHQVVSRVVGQMEGGPTTIPKARPDRLLIICLSRDNRRNAEALSDGLKDTGCVIQDRVERVMGAFQVLLALVDVTSAANDFQGLRKRLTEAGEKYGAKIIVQREDILTGAP